MSWLNFKALLPDDKDLHTAFDAHFDANVQEKLTSFFYIVMLHFAFDLGEGDPDEKLEFAHELIVSFQHRIGADPDIDRMVKRIDLGKFMKSADDKLEEIAESPADSSKERFDLIVKAAAVFAEALHTQAKKEKWHAH